MWSRIVSSHALSARLVSQCPPVEPTGLTSRSPQLHRGDVETHKILYYSRLHCTCVPRRVSTLCETASLSLLPSCPQLWLWREDIRLRWTLICKPKESILWTCCFSRSCNGLLGRPTCQHDLDSEHQARLQHLTLAAHNVKEC